MCAIIRFIFHDVALLTHTHLLTDDVALITHTHLLRDDVALITHTHLLSDDVAVITHTHTHTFFNLHIHKNRCCANLSINDNYFYEYIRDDV